MTANGNSIWFKISIVLISIVVTLACGIQAWAFYCALPEITKNIIANNDRNIAARSELNKKIDSNEHLNTLEHREMMSLIYQQYKELFKEVSEVKAMVKEIR